MHFLCFLPLVSHRRAPFRPHGNGSEAETAWQRLCQIKSFFVAANNCASGPAQASSVGRGHQPSSKCQPTRYWRASERYDLVFRLKPLGRALMTYRAILGRRRFLAGAASLAALGSSPSRVLAQTADVPASPSLPAREEFVIRDAHVLSMDSAVGELPQGDVHVRDGRIVAVGPRIPAPGVPIIEGADTVVLPGLVETHWHLWTSLLRGMVGQSAQSVLFPDERDTGPRVPAGRRLSGRAALHHRGAVRRGHHGHGLEPQQPDPCPLRSQYQGDVRRGYPGALPVRAIPGTAEHTVQQYGRTGAIQNEWSRYASEGLITLGMSWRGIGNFRGMGAGSAVIEANMAELKVAQRLKLPISVHTASSLARGGEIAALGEAGALGKDTLLAHGAGARPDEIKLMAETRTPISTTPTGEASMGYPCSRSRTSCRRESRSGWVSTPSRCRATPICSAR